jgi:hypothetical protein
MKNKLIFLSAKDLDSKVFNEEYEYLLTQGYGVIRSMSQDPEINNVTSMAILAKADILVFVGDWKGSDRTKQEYKLATALNKKVFFSATELNHFLLKGD